MDENELIGQAQELEAERVKKAALAIGKFDPHAILGVQTIYDEKLGVIQFCDPTYKEDQECRQIDSIEDRTVTTIWIALKKADPSITLEEVETYPTWKIARLGNLLGERIKSFLPKTTSP